MISIALLSALSSFAYAQDEVSLTPPVSAMRAVPHPGTVNPPNGRGFREHQVKTMRSVCAHVPIMWRASPSNEATLVASMGRRTVWLYVADTTATQGRELLLDGEELEIVLSDTHSDDVVSRPLTPGTIGLFTTDYLGVVGDAWGYFCMPKPLAADA